MTSLTALEHTAHPTPAFNGLFYATAPTIIPVFFLAIAVQGHGFQQMLHAAITGREHGPSVRSAIPFSCSRPEFS